MIAFAELSEDTTAFPWDKRTPWSGLEATVAIALALLIGRAAGHESAGAIAAGSAFTIGFAVYHEAASSTLLSMVMVTAGLASATLLGSLGAAWTPLVLLLAVIAAINYGLLSSLSPTAGWIGQQCGVYVVIASFFPKGTQYALGRANMVIVGGLLQMAVYGCSRLWHRREPRLTRLPERLRNRFWQLWAALAEEARLSNGAETLSYVLRLSLTLVLTTALYRHRHLGNGYWAPMTGLLVLKPQWAHTFSRGIARLAGTLVGVGLAVVLAQVHTLTPAFVFVLVMVSAWACFALQAVNYALFSMVLTLYVVFSFRFGGFSQPAAAHLRLLNTAIGGGVALAVDAAWKLFSPSTWNVPVGSKARARSVQ